MGEVESDLDGDEERRTAEHDRRDASNTLDDRRRYCKEAEEAGTRESNAIYHIADIFLCLATWADARDERAGLLEILRDAMRLERDGGVEIRKKHDEDEVGCAVLPRIREERRVPERRA